MNISWNCTHPQAIQDIDEFVSSSEQIWRNLALHHLLTSGSSAIFFLAFALRAQPQNSILFSQMKSLESAVEMSQRTLVDNVLYGFWFPTATVWIGGLAPPDKVDCTSTLSRPESVQHWPVSSRKVEARRIDRWLSYEGVVHNISCCPLITPCRIGCHILYSPARQVFSMTSGLLDAVWCPSWVATCHSHRL